MGLYHVQRRRVVGPYHLAAGGMGGIGAIPPCRRGMWPYNLQGEGRDSWAIPPEEMKGVEALPTADKGGRTISPAGEHWTIPLQVVRGGGHTSCKKPWGRCSRAVPPTRSDGDGGAHSPAEEGHGKGAGQAIAGGPREQHVGQNPGAEGRLGRHPQAQQQRLPCGGAGKEVREKQPPLLSPPPPP